MQKGNQATDSGHSGGKNESPGEVGREESEALAGRVMAAAADLTQREAVFLALVGEFDAAGAARWWDGLPSTAQWLSWACSIAPGTAREHVRVARALRGLPVIAGAFVRGELSYSKVRELTRLVGAHDEATLLRLARAATASQLARTVCSYRAVTGSHAAREQRTGVSWRNRPDGLVQITAVLLPEDGAVVVAALENATDEYRDDATNTCPGDETATTDEGATAATTGRADATAAEGDPSRAPTQVPADQAESAAEIEQRSRVQAFVAVSNHWLGSRPEDRSGADHTTVVIEIDAAELADTLAPAVIEGEAVTEPFLPVPGASTTAAHRSEPASAVPAGTPPESAAGPTAASPVTHVPAGTCRVRGHGGLEPDTVRRLACEARIHAIIRGLDGEPLAVSRSKRFGTRAQRRALMVRDQHCQFPSCARQRRLKIHHVNHWIDGGATELTNLLLLCQHHHSVVHEGHLTITANQGPLRWRFQRPDGSTIIPEVTGLRVEQALPLLCDATGRVLPDGPAREAAEHRRHQLVEQHRRRRARLQAQQDTITAQYLHVESRAAPDARRRLPIGGGDGFNLANCVEVLFGSQRPDSSAGHGDDRDEAMGKAA